MYETHIHSYGTFHLNRTVVVLLHKQAFPVLDCWHLMFSQHLTLFLILLSQIVHMLLRVSLTLLHVSKICSPYSSWFITSNFSSVLIVFHRFFTWLALGDKHFHFSFMFVRMSSVVEEETK